MIKKLLKYVDLKKCVVENDMEKMNFRNPKMCLMCCYTRNQHLDLNLEFFSTKNPIEKITNSYMQIHYQENVTETKCRSN